MLSGLQNGIQREIMGGIFVPHNWGCCGRSWAFLLMWGTNGNGCALFKGVLIDVMLSIPLMQGTKGVYLMVRDICCTPSADLGKSRRGQQLHILSHLG